MDPNILWIRNDSPSPLMSQTPRRPQRIESLNTGPCCKYNIAYCVKKVNEISENTRIVHTFCPNLVMTAVLSSQVIFLVVFSPFVIDCLLSFLGQPECDEGTYGKCQADQEDDQGNDRDAVAAWI